MPRQTIKENKLLKPVGIRFDKATTAALEELALKNESGFSSEVRKAVKQSLKKRGLI